MDERFLEDHIRQAEQELEAATHSLEAARRKHEQEGSAATAAFVRDAEVGYQQIQAEYQNALAAKGEGITATPARTSRARIYAQATRSTADTSPAYIEDTSA